MLSSVRSRCTEKCTELLRSVLRCVLRETVRIEDTKQEKVTRYIAMIYLLSKYLYVYAAVSDKYGLKVQITKGD